MLDVPLAHKTQLAEKGYLVVRVLQGTICEVELLCKYLVSLMAKQTRLKIILAICNSEKAQITTSSRDVPPITIQEKPGFL